MSLNMNKASLSQLARDRKFFLSYAQNLMGEANLIDKKSTDKLRLAGEKWRKDQGGWDEHSYWYGARVDIRDCKAPPAEPHGFSAPDVSIHLDDPAFVAGLFITLAQSWPDEHMTNNDVGGFDHPGKLSFFQHAAHIVSKHQESGHGFDANFARYFFQFVALSLSRMAGRIDIVLDENDQTRLLCDQTEFDMRRTKAYSFYFAYGSNMDPEQMHNRCPGAEPLAIGRYDGYRLIINSRGVATIVEDPESHCYGIVWAVSKEHLQSLDKFEGVIHGTYGKELAKVRVQDEILDSIVYVASDETPGMPRQGYVNKLVAGVAFFDGHEEWYDEVRALADFETIVA